VLVEAATNGEPWAISQVFDRIEGKPTQMLEHAGETRSLRISTKILCTTPEELERTNRILDDYYRSEGAKLIEATPIKGNGSGNGHEG
jgi:hypothetical protein